MEDFALGAALEAAPLVVVRETFGEEALRFDVDIRRISFREVKEMRDRCKKTVFVKHQPQEEVDQEKLRALLAEKCLVSWQGLTGAIAFAMSSRECPPDVAKTVVPPTAQNKLTMLAYARGQVGGETQTFEGWLWDRVNAIAEQRAEQEGAEKKT